MYSDQCMQTDWWILKSSLTRFQIPHCNSALRNYHLSGLVKSLSRVRLFATPWTAVYHTPPSRDFPGKGTGVGCHFLLQSGLGVPSKKNTHKFLKKLFKNTSLFPTTYLCKVWFFSYTSGNMTADGQQQQAGHFSSLTKQISQRFAKM